MAQRNRKPSEAEKEKIRLAIENGDKSTIKKLINEDCVDVNADLSLWWFWKSITNSWWKELLNWRYTALHHAVSVNNVQMVKLLVELGADITITNQKGISSKFPVQRAVDNGSKDVVYYFVRERGQDISTLSSQDQNTIRALVEEYEQTNPTDTSCSSGEESLPPTPIDCDAALKKIQLLYSDLSNLHIESILAMLVSKKVLTLDEERDIKEEKNKKQIQFLIDRIIVPSLKAHMSKKFKCFLEVLEYSSDALHKDIAKRLGGSRAIV